MSGTPLHLLEQIAAEETAARTAGDVARSLLAGHPDLPVTGVKLMRYEGFEVHLRLPDADAVAAWADILALGLRGVVPVRRLVEESSPASVFEHVTAVATVQGHRVRLYFCRILPEDEATAWREGRAAFGTGAVR
ncbi:hypothetical protein ACFWPV_22590 [Streptomyces uncialis]|uniref:hypothetical protein n=1 Tax=Streptomyces uncialis TaxID=1048205 RepID=UPI0036630BA8